MSKEDIVTKEQAKRLRRKLKDGNYWHGNKETMRSGKPNFMQLKNKQNDMIKNWVAKNAGYKLIRIWEKEIEEDYEGIKNKITNIITEINSI